MVIDLAKSSLRKKLLAYVFSQPKQTFYVREMARTLDVDPTNLSRELKGLSKQGLFSEEKIGAQKYFRLDPRYSMYKELKSIVNKTIGIPEILKRILNGIPGLKLVILYGSVAKGEEDSSSDMDVLIVGDVTAEEVADKITEVEKSIKREANFTLYSPTEFKKRKASRDPFLRDILGQKHQILIENK